MSIAFILLSFIGYVTTITLWRKQSYPGELKPNIILLALGLAVFHAIMGLLFVFDLMEKNPSHVLAELLTHPWSAIVLFFCLSNGLFYTVFAFLFLAMPVQQNQRS